MMNAPIREMWVRNRDKSWTMHRFADGSRTLCGRDVDPDLLTDPKRHPSPALGWRMRDCTTCWCESREDWRWCQVLGPNGYDAMHVTKSAREAALEAAGDAGFGAYRVRYLLEGVIRQHVLEIAEAV